MSSLRLIIACGQIPWTRTINDRLAESLSRACRHLGHRITRLRLPLPPRIEDLPAHFSAYRLLRLPQGPTGADERLIALDLAAACLRHDRKTLWIGEPLAGLEEWLDASNPGPALFETLSRSAELFASEATDRFAVSESVAAAMEEWAELGCRVLPDGDLAEDKESSPTGLRARDRLIGRLLAPSSDTIESTVDES